jgi:hypothetical protein
MPVLGLGLHVIIAAFFAIHVVRTGRQMYWLFILFAFPLLGSIVYALAVFLPDFRNSRAGMKVVRAMDQLIDPERELREATRAYEISPSAQNRVRLANALLHKDRADEAITHYEASLSGPLSDDASMLLGLAKAYAQAGRFGLCEQTLQKLIGSHPHYHAEQVQLLKARALGGQGKAAEAKGAFEEAVRVGTGCQARARYYAWLQSQGDTQAAQRVQQDIAAQIKHWDKFAREQNAAWLKMAGL